MLCCLWGLIKGFKDIKSIFCGVAATITDFEIVKKLRVYKELLIPLNGMKPTNKSDILEALMKGNLMELLVTLHKKSDEPFYFRLTAKDLDVATLGSKLEAMSGGRLINSTSDYEIEIKLISGAEGRVIAFLKLHTLNDYRFNYRIHHVAASIHPSEASVIAELSKDYLTKNAVVLDSFAGVGTMLIERNRLVKAKFMYAIDTFGKAVDGGRANAKAARADINYINKDYFDFSHEHLFDEIITNFPRFREREEADAFYGRFFAKTGEILKESGVVIMCSDEKNLVKKYLRLNENYKLLREFTFNEKEGQYVFIIKKTLTNT
jgi:23S rRNA G2445 N2-methylase RlmL